MVYRTKESDNPAIKTKKARFVVKGYLHKNKRERLKFAPTLKFALLRVLFALAAFLGLMVHQLDVKGTFLHGELPEPIFVEQPVNLAENSRNFVLKLRKSLYGLAESPRLWNEKLDTELKRIGFVRLESDPCVYVMHNNDSILVLASYVDDLLLFGTNANQFEFVKNQLRHKFRLFEAVVFGTELCNCAKWTLRPTLQMV